MAGEHGFEQSYLRRLFNESRKQVDIIEAISRPAEKVLNWKDYQDIFLTRKRIQRGGEFMSEYQSDLARAQKKYGVPKSIIAAIIGVETFYGTYLGNHRVIDALATLAFAYPPRGHFFRQELEQFLLLSREQGFEPSMVKGSYAGAMGYGQFIPSSYRHYAIDFNGDEVADLLNSPADAIGSVANYLSKHGWSAKKGVVAKATLAKAEDQYRFSRGLKLKQTISVLKLAGVRFQHSGKTSDKAKLLKLNGKQGVEYWVAMQNFYVITRYNHSNLYAMAVWQLSNELQQEYRTYHHDRM